MLSCSLLKYYCTTDKINSVILYNNHRNLHLHRVFQNTVPDRFTFEKIKPDQIFHLYLNDSASAKSRTLKSYTL